jgi:hypothetical protein
LWNEIIKQLKKNWPDYTIQFILLILVGGLITQCVAESLTPKTDISVSCDIKETGKSLQVSFYNNADFAGKQLYIYLWDVILEGRSNDYSVSEECSIANAPGIDCIGRTKIFCDVIPPKSEFSFTIYAKLSEEILKTRKLEIEWFGETTPYKKKVIPCD